MGAKGKEKKDREERLGREQLCHQCTDESFLFLAPRSNRSLPLSLSSLSLSSSQKKAFELKIITEFFLFYR
jgi:hypothetical protein